MTDTPLVSVIIPTFNSRKYIGRCLSALAMQSYSNMEVIIVDAGSTDDTRAVVDSFQYIHTIRYFTLSPSTQSEARNLGLQHASGKYIAFCDSDDFYLPSKLEKQISTIEKQQADVVYFDALHFHSNQPDEFYINKTAGTNDMLASSIHSLMMNLNTMLVRKQFLIDHEIAFQQGEAGRYAEDWYFVFMLALRQAKFIKLDEHLAVVEVRQDSHTQWSLQWKMKSVVIDFLSTSKNIMTPYHQRLVDESIKKLQRKMIVALILAGKFAEARALFKQTMQPSDKIFYLLHFLPKKLLNIVIISLWERNRKKNRQTYIQLNTGTQKYLNEILG